MSYQPHLPLIVQSDRTILLEVHNPLFDDARQEISAFAELIKSPEHIHTYKITPLSLWNAASSGLAAADCLQTLNNYSKFGIPPALTREILDTFGRYGLVRIEKDEEGIALVCDDVVTLTHLLSYPSLVEYVEGKKSDRVYRLKPFSRGLIKQELLKLGYPVQDLAGYTAGEACPIQLRSETASGAAFRLRDYQRQAIQAFYADGSVQGGSGVLVLPCGAGKTCIGIGSMCEIQEATLILTTNTTSVRQWIREILDKTDLHPDLIAEYSSDAKKVKPVTVATYQMLTYRGASPEEYPHMQLFNERNWGLIIYDEVHLLPAPVFKLTAGIQAKRRLGLTATLVREDGREGDVFSLVGPKKYDMPWKQLEQQGFLAQAHCQEIRLSMDALLREAYAFSSPREKYRIAALNPRKLESVKRLLKEHEDDQVLIIGQYLSQLEELARELNLPLITGKVKEQDREYLYNQFKTGTIKRLAVSKVANFAVDLPDANVAIQISGTFGSRQEEAQRLGRILRPKAYDNTAYFYTLVTANTREQEFAQNRQLFLVEQGYRYDIIDE